MMTFRRICSVCTGFVALGFATTLAIADEIPRWKLAPGQAYLLQFDQTTVSQTTAAKKTKKSTSALSTWVRWTASEATAADLPAELRELPADAVVLTQEVQRVRIQVTADGNEVIYDSALKSLPTGPAKEYAASVAPLLRPEAKQRLLLSGRGQVWLIGKPTDGKEASAVSQMLQRPLVILPAEAGQKSWTETSSLVTAAGKAEHKLTYTIAEGEAATPPLTIDVSGAMTLVPENATAKITEVVQFQQTGKLHFGVSEGRLLDSEQKTHLTTETPLREDKIRVEVNSQLTVKMTTATSPTATKE